MQAQAVTANQWGINCTTPAIATRKSESLDFLLCPLIWMISVKQLTPWTTAYRKSMRGINVSMVVSASPHKDI